MLRQIYIGEVVLEHGLDQQGSQILEFCEVNDEFSRFLNVGREFQDILVFDLLDVLSIAGLFLAAVPI